jgi:hypothetical protein
MQPGDSFPDLSRIRGIRMRWLLLNPFVLILTLLCFAPSRALADPIQWTLAGVTFDDGGSAFGSFLFDADTTTFSSVNIQTTAGTALAGVAYPDFASGDASILFLYSDPSVLGDPTPDFTGVWLLALGLTSPLTNAGGVIPLGSAGQGNELLCADADCIQLSGLRFVEAGAIEGEAVMTQIPEPSTLALVGIGLAALWMRRRRSRM